MMPGLKLHDLKDCRKVLFEREDGDQALMDQVQSVTSPSLFIDFQKSTLQQALLSHPHCPDRHWVALEQPDSPQYDPNLRKTEIP